ncbi:expressed unknown protein [Seminavis robusta]|uniref:Uncharacterized protein n=1 Tax=Seminavis robusta TaxID=568900 RepID=A0A9N8DCL5_9STRA|nr:expressed unknown protein [Seminavis robusta]|eukprot:Sro30_g019770.1 n/a (179) ;mRNA; f:122757-123386
MISEVVNALLLTYFGTEYLLAEAGNLPKRKTQAFFYLVASVIFVNIFDRVTGAAEVINSLLQGFLHLPKVLFAAFAYVVALYFDCKKLQAALTVKTFLPLVGKAFLRVLPAYPFLAVVISFGFMIVINIFEALHIPLEYLNWPIYYGTLYGPFSFVYWKVKERVVDDSYHTLPTKTPW